MSLLIFQRSDSDLTSVQTLFAAFFILRIASLIMLSTVALEPFGSGALKEA